MLEPKRKGARTIKDIPKDILQQLNRGEIETANLVEFLAVDRRILLENLLIQCKRKKYLQPILAHMDGLKKQTVITLSEAMGEGIFRQINNDSEFFQAISTHRSDLVRCCAADTVGKNTKLSLRQMFQKIKPFAADKHFNVRECAWTAVRTRIVANLHESIAVLTAWAKDKDENIRRFASEATRPRGVWCEHIKELKENPELALPILEPLKSDSSRYVQNSVGNWLNDAGKTKPEFVVKLCRRWESESDTKETRYITKRALRSIVKKAQATP